jgi:2-keto-4-pentenoate hydratase/2-oxohepta-3-ene-1,7-dioic acid hydratase in catechol pathway
LGAQTLALFYCDGDSSPTLGSFEPRCELGVRLRSGAARLPWQGSKAEALAQVWCYTIINDVTARDLQVRHGKWLIGKSQDTFFPMGPWAVTRDALLLAGLQVQWWINGKLRQDVDTCLLIFDESTIIATVSAGVTLMSNDLIATSTPAGVGVGFKPSRYLDPGDFVRIEILWIGVLENEVREWRT